MISIGNVVSVAAGVRYFDEAVAETQADYYAARGEAPGLWRGTAATSLGLTGRVERADFIRVLEGRHPATGDELGHHYGSQRNVAFDVTYSLPKSVSLLYALGDDHVRAAVMHALDEGASAAHGYLQRHAGWGRVYDAGNRQIDRVAAEFVTASFVHRTARPVTRDGVTTVDPQLHTHLVVASFVRRANGTWGQLYSEPLYSHAAAAGAVGQAATRDSLVRDLGVRVHTKPNGTFEADGFTEEQLAEFSQRHRQALAAAGAVGATSLHGTKVAVVGSRQSKHEIEPGTDLFADWERRAETVGIRRQDVAGLLDSEPVRELRWFDVDTVRDVVGRGETGLTSQASVFSRRDVVRSLAAHAPLGMRPERIESLADAILEEGSSVVAMVPPAEAGAEPAAAMRRWAERGLEVHYSTPEVVSLERRMLRSAEVRRGEGICVLAADRVAEAVSGSPYQLTDGQRTMVEAVCASPDGVVVVEGAAGTGKTTAMRVLRDAHRSTGTPVIGCAPSGRATVALQEEASIPSFTTASLLMRLREGEHLAAGGVVVVDECSMLGPDLAELVLMAHRDRAKLVLVGDSQQLQPIDGGAVFRSLGDRLGRIELTEVIRQQERWDREVLMALREGRAAPLVRRYLDEGRVHSSDDQATRVATMAADWVAAAQDGHDVIAVARQRAVVVELNAVTRAAARDAGLVAGGGVRRECVDHLGKKVVSLGELEFGLGDQVLLVGRNKRRLGLVKGLRGTVCETRPDGTIVLACGDGRRVPVPPSYQGVSHGYALTAHRAQGATADIALVHGSDAADRQWQYVALSRHRIRAAYYDVAPADRDAAGVHHGAKEAAAPTEARLLASMSRDGSKPSTLDYPEAYDRQLLHVHAARSSGGTTAMPTESQLEILTAHGLVDELPPVATWVHASLVIDGVHGAPCGKQARAWLLEAGTPPEEADRVIGLALRDLDASRAGRRIGRSAATTGAAPTTRRSDAAATSTDYDWLRRAAHDRRRAQQRRVEHERAARRNRDSERARHVS